MYNLIEGGEITEYIHDELQQNIFIKEIKLISNCKGVARFGDKSNQKICVEMTFDRAFKNIKVIDAK